MKQHWETAGNIWLPDIWCFNLTKWYFCEPIEFTWIKWYSYRSDSRDSRIGLPEVPGKGRRASNLLFALRGKTVAVSAYPERCFRRDDATQTRERWHRFPINLYNNIRISWGRYPSTSLVSVRFLSRRGLDSQIQYRSRVNVKITVSKASLCKFNFIGAAKLTFVFLDSWIFHILVRNVNSEKRSSLLKKALRKKRFSTRMQNLAFRHFNW